VEEVVAGHPGDHQRIFFGRAEDKSAELRFKDTGGRDPIVIEVNPYGTPVLQFLDGKENRESAATDQWTALFQVIKSGHHARAWYTKVG
jgi:hypothetical protein